MKQEQKKIKKIIIIKTHKKIKTQNKNKKKQKTKQNKTKKIIIIK